MCLKMLFDVGYVLGFSSSTGDSWFKGKVLCRSLCLFGILLRRRIIVFRGEV